MPSNKMVGAVALGAAALLMRNKQTREKTMNTLKSYVDPQTIENVKSKFQNISKTEPRKSIN
ncbi:hypothetical protein I6J18_01145 [Peribacillus psychrosaccharolyticus]|uniref:Uncharacterized protein n=1 Tax=Peribacillus psychrosaccharolyticus TaxID=1407 RepID=A0A974S0J1_PERPY|nr:hypothetical protein [Peribacillus psychrosaccharolyticus]MEC2056241.1 hypothetical protein [Peribacillus psychrosaccharolyticus]MED3743643.1 hypothetical protein [Peribacillus psychrosaccharolyticus]QQT00579.1 hypothetical protein I6J18_01145 [Peribacillus psychrosaccharolyticus]